MEQAVQSFQRLWDLVLKEAAKFGVVGGIAFIIDSGIYLALLHSQMGHKPLVDKTISSVIATIFSYYANRYWTFKGATADSKTKEFIMFFLMNGVAIIISLLCVAISHYVLGYTSKTADFISGSVIGLILGTIFRFFAYRTWVFKKELDDEGLETYEEVI
ncbi:MAG: GtrA family protein [Micrococcaceae bacterium]